MRAYSDGQDADEPIAESVLAPEPFPAAAELVLAQHILTWELAAGNEVAALFLRSLNR